MQENFAATNKRLTSRNISATSSATPMIGQTAELKEKYCYFFLNFLMHFFLHVFLSPRTICSWKLLVFAVIGTILIAPVVSVH